MKLPNGIETNKTIFLGVDWSRKKVDVYDGEKWHKFANLRELAEKFPNSVVFLESTAESYELQNRKDAIEAFKQHNIEAYCFPPKWTARYRADNNILKNDKNDARAIYMIGTVSSKPLCKFKEITDDQLGEHINDFLIHDRYALDCEETKKLAEQYLQNYPPQFEQFMKGGDKEYRKQVGRFVAVAIGVRQAGRGFREFRRQIGNYAHGYGRMPRSEFYWWWTKMAVTTARFKQAGLKVKKNKKQNWWNRLTAKQQGIHRDVLKEADKALKYIWKSTESVSNSALANNPSLAS